MLYRALCNLSKGDKIIEAGTVFAGSLLSDNSIAVLERMEKISPVSTPPLIALPAWREMGKKLSKSGISTVQDFVEANDDELALALKNTPAWVRNAKREILDTLKTPLPRG